MVSRGEHRPDRQAAVAVVALGSVLRRDDGVGPTVVRRLRARYSLPAEVEALDLGTPGPLLHCHLENRVALVLIDTVRADDEPGKLRCYRGEDLASPTAAGPRTGPHDPGLAEALATLDLLGQRPQVLLIGVIPSSLEAGTELSAEVEAALPEVERRILVELERLGHPATARIRPETPDLWWKRK